MALDPEQLLSLPPWEVRQTYAARDTILYALGVGVAQQDPLAPSELGFVYEEGLAALPTMAVVLAYPGFWQRDPKLGLDWRRILHGEQAITLHRPLPAAGRVRAEVRIDDVIDKGADKGAVLYWSREIFDDETGHRLATVRQTSFLRGDGGFGGRRDGGPSPHAAPAREPDLHLTLPTRSDQALIYRLSGDYNPLHADPLVASAAGFERPILHGLCTYGIAGRALLRLLCEGRPERLRRLDARFSQPVFPGETIRVEAWREGQGRAAFRALAVERGVVVLSNGYAEHD